MWASDVLNVIIAQKLLKKVKEVPLSKSIKDLVGGKLTLQHEISGNFQMEFVSMPEKGEELPLEGLVLPLELVIQAREIYVRS